MHNFVLLKNQDTLHSTSFSPKKKKKIHYITSPKFASFNFIVVLFLKSSRFGLCMNMMQHSHGSMRDPTLTTLFKHITSYNNNKLTTH